MGKYKEITEARKMLGLNEEETLRDIKKKIRALLKKYHPDTCDKGDVNSNEKSMELIKAKQIILGYCDEYRISFHKDEIKKYLPPEELWSRQFGSDHIWSNTFDEK
jgi:preprotein translocase subunit Sec63